MERLGWPPFRLKRLKFGATFSGAVVEMPKMTTMTASTATLAASTTMTAITLMTASTA